MTDKTITLTNGKAEPEIVQPQGQTFEAAVLDMGELFNKMHKTYKIPPAVTMDIVRLQLMYMQQSGGMTAIPSDAPPEVIMAEQFEAQEDE
jgi:hypothetical protein